MLIKILILLLLTTPSFAATISGGITFEKGKEVPQKMKDWVKANGIRTPLGKNVKYSNSKLDNWFRIRKKDGVYKPVRVDSKIIEFVKEKDLPIKEVSL